MKTANAIAAFVLLLAVTGVGYYSYHRVARASVTCDICGRSVETHHQSSMVLKNGRTEHACCPRCALHYGLNHEGQVASLWVMDRLTGSRIRADNAFYVEGSDDHSCIPPSETPPHDLNVDYVRKYDRCIPGLVSFSDEDAAHAFQAEHGGRVLTYAQAIQSVKQQ